MVHIQDIEQAEQRVRPFVRRTPLVCSATLSRLLGVQTHLKLELLQKTGSFKPRGAFNQMLRLTPAQRERGVVAVSGGNFAQGAAFAGHRIGARTTICMPQYTPANYVEATRGYGAEIELHPDMPSCFARVQELKDDGWTALHAWDNPDQIAGNGTLGLELLDQLPAMTDLIVSIGGGGLIAGLMVAIKNRRPQVRIWGVETQGAPTMGAALQAGKVVQIVPNSLAKTLSAPFVAADALVLARDHLEDYVAVTDQEAVADQRFLLERTKQLTELAAACTLSAARRWRSRFQADGQLVLLLCGGNESLQNMKAYPTPHSDTSANAMWSS